MTAAVSEQPSPAKWWIPLIGGIAAIVVSIMFWMNPVNTSLTLVYALGFYWIFLGILDLINGFRSTTGRAWSFFMGIVGIIAGALILSAFRQGEGGALTFWLFNFTTIMIGVMGILYGVLALISSFRGAGWMAAVWGVLSVLFGLLILGRPLIATLSLPWVIAAFLMVEGIFMIFAAFQLRSASR